MTAGKRWFAHDGRVWACRKERGGLVSYENKMLDAVGHAYDGSDYEKARLQRAVLAARAPALQAFVERLAAGVCTCELTPECVACNALAILRDIDK